jgi:hypothetical protein
VPEREGTQLQSTSIIEGLEPSEEVPKQSNASRDIYLSERAQDIQLIPCKFSPWKWLKGLLFQAFSFFLFLLPLLAERDPNFSPFSTQLIWEMKSITRYPFPEDVLVLVERYKTIDVSLLIKIKS